MGKKIAIIGSRGIPARYGGFETFTEEIGTRLAARDYDICVSCESGSLPEYKGVKLMYCPVKPVFRSVYEILYDVYFLFRTYPACDSVYVLGIGSAPCFFISKIFKKKIILNFDGIEWKRNKFNRLQKGILYFQGMCAIMFSDIIVADALAIKRYIESKGGKNVVYIPYGVETPEAGRWDQMKITRAGGRLKGLEEGHYYLAVARLEPENNINMMIEGFLLSGSKNKLVVIGDFQNKKYRALVEETMKRSGGQDRVIFTGAIYEKDILNMLRQHCFVYLHGHSVGGTNPSLLEAMAMKNIVLAHDNEYNREVGGDALIYFPSPEGLADRIQMIEGDPAAYQGLKDIASRRVSECYSWEKVTDEYDKLFKSL